MEKAIVAWSGGKDSAMALYEARKSGEYEIVSLLTTVTEGYDRISMHGVRKELLERQAASIGLPLKQVLIPKESSNQDYEKNMRKALVEFTGRGVTKVIFGDIFLEDLRRYREEKLAGSELTAVFPLWKEETALLAKRFIALGFKAILTCVDTSVLDGKFAGRLFDAKLLSDMPAKADPCGENGEFHSFVFDGPVFRKRVDFTAGEAVLRDDRFLYQDLLPSIVSADCI